MQCGVVQVDERSVAPAQQWPKHSTLPLPAQHVWLVRHATQVDVDELLRQRDVGALCPFYTDLQPEIMRIQVSEPHASAA